MVAEQRLLDLGVHGLGDDPDVERGSLALGALGVDVAAHHLGQLPADRETEPGSSVTTRGRGIHLAEGTEQPVHPLRRYADPGVADADVHLVPSIVEPARGEL
jgi:hypothetical protein